MIRKTKIKGKGSTWIMGAPENSVLVQNPDPPG